MVQLSQLSQSIEISSSTKKDSIKFILKIKDSQLSTQSRSSDGILLMAKTLGLSKILGELTGESTVLRIFLSI